MSDIIEEQVDVFIDEENGVPVKVVDLQIVNVLPEDQEQAVLAEESPEDVRLQVIGAGKLSRGRPKQRDDGREAIVGPPVSHVTERTSGPKTYSCKLCAYETGDVYLLICHHRTRRHKLNKSKALTCKICNYYTWTQDDLTRHCLTKEHLYYVSILGTDVDGLVLSCKHCQFTTECKESYFKHRNTVMHIVRCLCDLELSQRETVRLLAKLEQDKILTSNHLELSDLPKLEEESFLAEESCSESQDIINVNPKNKPTTTETNNNSRKTLRETRQLNLNPYHSSYVKELQKMKKIDKELPTSTSNFELLNLESSSDDCVEPEIIVTRDDRGKRRKFDKTEVIKNSSDYCEIIDVCPNYYNKTKRKDSRKI